MSKDTWILLFIHFTCVCFQTRYLAADVTPLSDGDLRLVDGDNAAHGRLEVYHAGQWGTVCDNHFNYKAATVACKQLGYQAGHTEAGPQGSGIIWLDDVYCNSINIARLVDCGHLAWGRHDCDHDEDVSIMCNNHSTAVDGMPLSDGDLRLVGGDHAARGRLEVYHARQWGTVCDDRFNYIAATVACKQLGYQAGHTEAGPKGSGIIWLDDVVCNSINVARLVECSHLGWSKNDCNHDEDLSIICYNDRTGADGTPLSDGDLRLVDGDHPAHGRLEVYHWGQWGTVCDDAFTDIAATVACKQLGYQAGYIKDGRPGSGIIWLDNVVCSSTDVARLINCSHLDGTLEDCDHSEDISIMCYTDGTVTTAARTPAPSATGDKTTTVAPMPVPSVTAEPTAKDDATMNSSKQVKDSQSWIPIVAGVVGCVAVISVVILGVVCYIKRRRNNSTKRNQPQNALSDRHQRRNVANLPKVASDEYEEIGEPYYLEPKRKGIAGPADDHQYEMLQRRSKRFDHWIKRNHIPQTTQAKLHRQTILTIDDLKKLTKKDILDLGLTVGERNRLKTALEKLKK